MSLISVSDKVSRSSRLVGITNVILTFLDLAIVAHVRFEGRDPKSTIPSCLSWVGSLVHMKLLNYEASRSNRPRGSDAQKYFFSQVASVASVWVERRESRQRGKLPLILVGKPYHPLVYENTR